MSAISTIDPHAPEISEPRLFRVGTLKYTQQELYVLFFWLMWNDATITLLQDPIGFGGFLQKDHGATNLQISIFGTIGTIMNVIINPVFSVWSDRTRTKWGRRRPFLLLCTPPLAMFIMAMPYMPNLEHYLLRYPSAVSFFRALHIDGAVLMVGICTLAITFFNSIVGTLFSYLYWDVVPQEVLGRWTSMTKIVGAVVGFGWQFFFFGMADHHMKALCIGVSIFAMSAYILSIWKVKEGGYPPVDKHKKGGPAFAGVRAFFVECFSDPFYLWIFGGFAFASINWGTDGIIAFYLRYNLHLDYTTMGEFKAWPGLLTVVLGYFLGSMTDKLHPMRIFVPSYIVLGFLYVGSFIFVHDKWSFLLWTCLITVGQFANGVTYGALLPQIFPREKFGQFCSANACCSMGLNLLIGMPIAAFFDYLKDQYRYGYLMGAFSMFGAALVFMKVHSNFTARHGKVPVPHAG